MAYVIGDLVRVKVTWTDIADALVDPTTVVLKVKSPANVISTYTYALGEVVKDSTGVYHYDVATALASGTWHYRWEAAGAAIGADEGSFYVGASAVL